jgi:hypothetical protein
MRKYSKSKGLASPGDAEEKNVKSIAQLSKHTFLDQRKKRSDVVLFLSLSLKVVCT